MSLVKTRRYAAPMALVTLISFLAPMLPPRAAKADTGGPLDGISLGTGGSSSLAGPVASPGTPQALATTDLATGTAHSTYPFQLPTARGEAQPSLALTYDSSQGVGFAGTGWTLNVPSIVRKGTAGIPRFVDGKLDVTADDYIADGQLLVPICLLTQTGTTIVCPFLPPGEVFPAQLAGASLSKWTYFRRELDDGRRYFLSPDGLTWLVQAKSGQVRQFGHPLDGAFTDGIERPDPTSAQIVGGSATAVHRWDLVRETDASGNTVYYTYDKLQSLSPSGSPVSGIQYLSEIYDTLAIGSAVGPGSFAHHVHLTWSLMLATGSDPFPPYSTSPIWRALPSAHVSVVDVTSAEQSLQRQLVRRYSLTYTFNQTATATYLASVQLMGTCGTASPITEDTSGHLPSALTCPTLPATTYQYTGIVPSQAGSPPSILQSQSVGQAPNCVGNLRMQFVDANGDGASDAIQDCSGSLQHDVYTAPGPLTASPAWTRNFLDTEDQNLADAIFGDWLSTGRLSIWFNNPSVNFLYPQYSFADDLGSLAPRGGISGPNFPGPDLTKAADIDGDGLPDMSLIPPRSPTNPNQYQTYFTLRDRKGATQPFAFPSAVTCASSGMAASSYSYGPDTVRSMADMDGDGIADIVIVEKACSNIACNPNTPTNVVFRILPGRGDGRYGTPQNTSGCPIGSGDNVGIGWTNTGNLGNNVGPDLLKASALALGDANGDGFADYALLNTQGLNICLRYGPSWASAVFECTHKTLADLGLSSADISSAQLAFVDLNAIGTPQVVLSTAAHPFHAFWMAPDGILVGGAPTPRTGLLQSVSNGAGATTTIHYQNSFALGMKLPIPTWVVQSVSAYNGLSLTSGATYTYSSPVYDARDRQFVGFKSVVETQFGDPGAPGLVRTTTFATDACATSINDSSACMGSLDYSFYRALRGLPTVIQEDDGTGGGGKLRTVVKHYTVTVPYGGMDARSVNLVSLDQEQTYLWGPPLNVSHLTAVNVVSTPSHSVSASVNIPTVATQLLQQRTVDGFGNELCVIDFGNKGVDTPIRRCRNWRDPSGNYFPMGDQTGWSFRVHAATTASASMDGTTPVGLVREYDYQYDPLDRITQVSGVLSGTLPLAPPHSTGVRTAGQPSEGSKDGPVQLAAIAYDGHGNVQLVAGPNGTCTGTAYDTVFAQLPVQSSAGCFLPGSLTTLRSYLRGLERVTMETTPANEVTVVKYDGFGRVNEVDQPDAGMPGATAAAAAVKGVTYVDSGPVRSVYSQTVDGPESAPSYVGHYQYLDGFGDTIATLDQNSSDGSQWIVSGVHTRYEVGRVATVYRPFLFRGVASAFPAATAASTYAQSIPTRSFTYDALGRLLTSTDFSHNPTVMTYSPGAAGGPTVTIKDPEQQTGGLHSAASTVVTSDGFGRVIQTDNLFGADGCGLSSHLIAKTTYQATGEPTTIQQSSTAHCGQVTLPSVTRRMQYDSLGRMVFNAEPNTSGGGGGWTYAYNDGGQLVGTSDARGCGKNIFHDTKGRVLAEDYSTCDASQAYTQPNLLSGNGTEAYYGYDIVTGRLADVWDRAQHSHYTYDARGRIVKLERQIATPTADQSLLLRYAPHTFQKTVSSYLASNRIQIATTGADAPELLPDGVSLASSWVSAAYALDGSIQSVSSGYGQILTLQQIDQTGGVVHINQQFGDAGQTMADLSYDNNGALLTHYLRRNVNGTSGPWISQSASYSPPSSSDPNNTLQGTLTNLTIQRDKVGNPTSMSDSAPALQWPAGAKPASSRGFTYHDDYRLNDATTNYATADLHDQFNLPYTSAELANATYPQPASTPNRVRDQQFSYDWRGNPTLSTDDVNLFFDRSLQNVANGTSQSSTLGPDQLQGASTTNSSATLNGVAYDFAGNLTGFVLNPSETAFNYTWDEVGQLSSATRTERGQRVSREDYTYDADGQRVRSTRHHFTAGLDIGQDHTVNVFDSLVLEHGQFLVAYEADAATEHVFLGAGGSVAAHVFYDTTGALPTAGPNGRNGPTGRVHMFMDFGDSIGSTSFVVDHDTGELVERATYQAYGAVESDYRPPRWGAVREDTRYTGHWDDAAVGLVYFGARYYAPQLGRFISPDPLTIHGLAGDSNPYAFVGGSPIGNSDPLGLEGNSGDTTCFLGICSGSSGVSIFGIQVSGGGGGGGGGGISSPPSCGLTPCGWTAGGGGSGSTGSTGGGNGYSSPPPAPSPPPPPAPPGGPTPQLAGAIGRAVGTVLIYSNPATAVTYGFLRDAFTAADPTASMTSRSVAGASLAMSMLPLIGRVGPLLRAASEFAQVAEGFELAEGAAQGARFSSFDALKKAVGPAGDGMQWHHIVEQTPGNLARFGPGPIQNTGNVIRLDTMVHRQISGFYSSIQPFTGGATVRSWLSAQSFQLQQQFGQEVLLRFGVSF